jgi:hypothetical protein
MQAGRDANHRSSAVGEVGMTDGRIELSGGDEAVGVTLSVVLHSRSGSALTWVYVGGGGPGGLEISRETAWLLASSLSELLDSTKTINSKRLFD